MSGFAIKVFKDNGRPANADEVEAMVSVFKNQRSQVRTDVFNNIACVVADSFLQRPERFVFDSADLLVVCDAEIFNYEDFFEGIPDPNWSEAELIARLYQQSPESWFSKINGAFVAFVWDKKSKDMLFYADKIGVKRLMYTETKEYICVSSRLKCLSDLDEVDKSLNPQAIYSFLAMEMIPTPFTIFKGIHKLESGHLLKFNSEVKIEKYWNMKYSEAKITDEAQLKEEIYNRLKSAVKLQVNYRANINDVGAFLSGGTDSSSIAGLLNELYPGEAKTFSIGFDESGFDEMEFARIAVKAYDTKHTEYYVTKEDVLNTLDVMVGHYDEPFGNSSAIPSFHCSSLAREQGLKIMMGGDGGDEIFGGNSRYVEVFKHFSRYPQWMVDYVFTPVLTICPEPLKIDFLKKIENYVVRSKKPLWGKIHGFSLNYYFKDSDIYATSFLNSQKLLTPEDISEKYIRAADTNSPLDQFLFHDLKITLMDNDLVKVGQMADSAGMEIRYPFLDNQLVEYTGQIEPGLKIKDGYLRYIFKGSMSKLLPNEIINKSKKGFGLPVVPWMLRSGPLNDKLESVIFSDSLKNREIINPKFIEMLYGEAKKDPTTFYGTYLFYIFILELWLQKHL